MSSGRCCRDGDADGVLQSNVESQSHHSHMGPSDPLGRQSTGYGSVDMTHVSSGMATDGAAAAPPRHTIDTDRCNVLGRCSCVGSLAALGVIVAFCMIVVVATVHARGWQVGRPVVDSHTRSTAAHWPHERDAVLSAGGAEFNGLMGFSGEGRAGGKGGGNGPSSWPSAQELESSSGRTGPVDALPRKEGLVRYPSTAPSDSSIDIPATVGCLQTMCEPAVAELGKHFGDDQNGKLLDCIQRTGMSEEESMACFDKSDVEGSPFRHNLFMCGVCRGCLKVSRRRKTKLQCAKKYPKTAPSDWQQYVPHDYGGGRRA